MKRFVVHLERKWAWLVKHTAFKAAEVLDTKSIRKKSLPWLKAEEKINYRSPIRLCLQSNYCRIWNAFIRVSANLRRCCISFCSNLSNTGADCTWMLQYVHGHKTDSMNVNYKCFTAYLINIVNSRCYAQANRSDLDTQTHQSNTQKYYTTVIKLTFGLTMNHEQIQSWSKSRRAGETKRSSKPVLRQKAGSWHRS